MTNTAIKTDHIVNGIDTARIVELATKMSQDDSYGNFRFRADNEWVNGNLSRSRCPRIGSGLCDPGVQCFGGR